MIMRVLWEVGRPCRLHRDGRPAHRLTNFRLIRSFVPSSWGQAGDERWYRHATETKRGEMDGKDGMPVGPGFGQNAPRGIRWTG
jgi:hypothetical protein